MGIKLYVFMNEHKYLQIGRVVPEKVSRLLGFDTDELFVGTLMSLYREQEVTTIDQARKVALSIVGNYYKPLDDFEVEWI